MLTQSAKEYMIKTLHKYHRGDKWVNELFGATGKDLENVSDKLQQDYNNLFFDTCDESGAQVYEKDLGITTTLKDLGMRRAKIQSKWLAKSFSCIAIIQAMTNQFYGEDILKVEYEDGEIIYKPIVHGELSSFEEFLNAVDEIKPAHIGYSYSWHYVKWGDFVKGVDKCRYITWEEVFVNKWEEYATKKWSYVYADITVYKNITWGELYNHGTWERVRLEDIK